MGSFLIEKKVVECIEEANCLAFQGFQLLFLSSFYFLMWYLNRLKMILLNLTIYKGEYKVLLYFDSTC